MRLLESTVQLPPCLGLEVAVETRPWPLDGNLLEILDTHGMAALPRILRPDCKRLNCTMGRRHRARSNEICVCQAELFGGIEPETIGGSGPPSGDLTCAATLKGGGGKYGDWTLPITYKVEETSDKRLYVAVSGLKQ
jgi:hypothetical protein